LILGHNLDEFVLVRLTADANLTAGFQRDEPLFAAITDGSGYRIQDPQFPHCSWMVEI
jgi:hypothetical protein